jgi:hypothetical protein
MAPLWWTLRAIVSPMFSFWKWIGVDWVSPPPADLLAFSYNGTGSMDLAGRPPISQLRRQRLHQS